MPTLEFTTTFRIIRCLIFFIQFADYRQHIYQLDIEIEPGLWPRVDSSIDSTQQPYTYRS